MPYPIDAVIFIVLAKELWLCFFCTELSLIHVYLDWLFLQGMVLVWESYKLDPYVQKLAEAVFNFQEKVQY